MRGLVLVCLVALAAAPAVVRAQAELVVPRRPATPILLDGQLPAAEWQDAAGTSIAGQIRLLLKESGGDVFLAVSTGGRRPRPVDLYVQTEAGEIFQLHASAQIGERHLPPSGWGDTVPPWRWGNHVGWLANEAKLDAGRPAEAPFAQRAFEADGVEFQIRRARFPGGTWRMRVDVGSFPGTEGAFRFPATATDEPATWALIRLPVTS